MYRSHIKTANSIIIMTDTGNFPVAKGTPEYDQALVALQNKEFTKLPDIVDKRGKIHTSSKGMFTTKGDDVFVKGEKDPMPRELSTKVLEFCEAGLNFTPLLNFWKNLKRNPSLESRKDLYTFLMKNKIALTEDGHFLAYKYVTPEFLDCNSRTFDNHPGKVVEMPRDQVDPNRHNTCSTGLHVAAFEYVKSESHTIVEVKVNPKDVVSVPTDYNAQKMRCCRYEVLCQWHHGEDKPFEELVYDEKGSQRTYYYKGRKGRPFSSRLVTGKKPSRFSLTCRATDTADAQGKLERLFKKA